MLDTKVHKYIGPRCCHCCMTELIDCKGPHNCAAGYQLGYSLHLVGADGPMDPEDGTIICSCAVQSSQER